MTDKHPGGRPAKFKTPEEMQEKIDQYFEECGVTFKVGYDGLVKHPTVTGLSVALGFADRQSLIDYAGKDEFSCTIKQAKLKIEEHLEQCLHNSSVAGTIFNLKNNFGWKDKHEQEFSGSIGINGLLGEIDGTGRGLPKD